MSSKREIGRPRRLKAALSCFIEARHAGMCTSARITTFCVYFCSTSVSSLIDDMHKAKTRGALNVFRRQSLLRAAFNNHLYTTALCSEIHKYVAVSLFLWVRFLSPRNFSFCEYINSRQRAALSAPRELVCVFLDACSKNSRSHPFYVFLMHNDTKKRSGALRPFAPWNLSLSGVRTIIRSNAGSLGV